MYLIATRSFPPEIGGMQSLMWGLAREMSKNFMIKVFAEYHENHKECIMISRSSMNIIAAFTVIVEHVLST